VSGRRLPPPRERRAALLARGWERTGTSWRHARFGPSAFFSLAAAEKAERDPERFRDLERQERER
jgi:hypothetical protein